MRRTYRLPILNRKGEKVAETILDEQDFTVLRSKTLHLNNEGYVQFSIQQSVNPYRYKHVRVHRFIMRPAKGFVVDHINGDPLDNRRKNLRVCTSTENTRNQRTEKNKQSSGRVGVNFFVKQNCWQARITHNRRSINLGNWKTQDLAEAARIGAEKALWGNFAPSKGVLK